MGVIINGVYYKGNKKPDKDKQASTNKQYEHDMQRMKHQRDLLQPWKNGKANEEFREQYPEEAKEYFK